jgi:hypothetical protein
LQQGFPLGFQNIKKEFSLEILDSQLDLPPLILLFALEKLILLTPLDDILYCDANLDIAH